VEIDRSYIAVFSLLFDIFLYTAIYNLYYYITNSNKTAWYID